MLKGLEGRRALVTGASGGIGRAIAVDLHARGAHVIVSGRRAEVLDSLAAGLGGRCEVVRADLADRRDTEALAEVAAGVDVLIANAGLPGTGRLEEYSDEQLDRVLDVNLRAPIVLARSAAPPMALRGEGAIVFMGSASGKTTTGNQSLYCGTKFGLRGFALSLREDMHGSGVGVTHVAPGPILEAGMFADTGLGVPRGSGARTPRHVTAAVARAIERAPAEIDVASVQLRLIGRVFLTAPGLFNALGRHMGATRIAADFADRQSAKR
ncbi:MAG TPA: SDR family NAD(P)-dependent oxidoreductase [Thermoleophilaceae bacterium]|nr:SDR family NAD(P)-dependent oxidoreductase [Thermoleophilaceae bacterium]